MREIKFRAWDGEKMREVKSLHLGTGRVQVSSQWGNTSLEPQSYILMQYTGLTDKNGVEIYEGDVVSIVPEWVVGDEAEADYTRIEAVKPEMDWNCGCCNSVYGWNFDESMSDSSELTVIGNTHEHPELLEG